jgi:uncharacterized protein YcaQ
VEIAPIILSLLRAKKLQEVVVGDIKKSFVVLAEDTPELDVISAQDMQSLQMVFIAPLDNLVWDRQMIEDFFGFTYRWEVYTPLAKRQYGYYVLPILYGDRFVGRIEPILDKSKTLTIRGLWKENDWDKATEKAFEMAILQFQTYLKAEKIVGL